jgi:nucleotide-binding universal stress UspA family protein
MTAHDLFSTEWALGATATSFRSLVVPIDFGSVGDRALATATVLAARAPLSVHLATTISAGLDTSRDEADLARRAVRLGLAEVSIDIIETDDVPAGRDEVMRTLPAPLLCIATHGRTAIGEIFLGSTTEDLLLAHRGPALVIGPEADPVRVPSTLAVCVDPGGASVNLERAAAGWKETFGGQLEVVEVTQPTLTARALPHALFKTAQHLHAPVRTIASHDPAQALIELALDCDVVLAVASHLRHGLARIVLGSVAWETIQRSPTPVLVVPTPPA